MSRPITLGVGKPHISRHNGMWRILWIGYRDEELNAAAERWLREVMF